MSGGRVFEDDRMRVLSAEKFTQLTAGLTMALFRGDEQVSGWVPFEAGEITARLGFRGRITEVRYQRDGQTVYTATPWVGKHRRRSRLCTVPTARLPLTALSPGG